MPQKRHTVDQIVAKVETARCHKVTEPDSNHKTETSARIQVITSGAASERQQRVWPKTELEIAKSCGHCCRAAGEKSDAHRLVESRKSFFNKGISRPLSLPAHEKTPRSRRFATVGLKLW